MPNPDELRAMGAEECQYPEELREQAQASELAKLDQKPLGLDGKADEKAAALDAKLADFQARLKAAECNCAGCRLARGEIVPMDEAKPADGGCVHYKPNVPPLPGPTVFFDTEVALKDLDKVLEAAGDMVRAAKVRVIKASMVQDGLAPDAAEALQVTDEMIEQLDQDLGMAEPAAQDAGVLATAPAVKSNGDAQVKVLQKVPAVLELSPMIPRPGNIVLVGWFDKGKQAIQTCAMTWKVKAFRPKDGKLTLRPFRVHKSL